MMLRILCLLLLCFVAVVVLYAVLQRKLLYYPTHNHENHGMAEWRYKGELIGYCREVASPGNVWLMTHGNGGEASDRAYALPSFSRHDSVFVLEYPGYGNRAGSPSMASFNAAAMEAYRLLREQFPHRPVCVVGESIGSGPASSLAALPHPPDKIVLITPFDVLSNVASHHLPFLPARLLLRDNWNNVQALRGYKGPIEIFAARDDTIIPFRYAKALADSKPSATLHQIPGGHNDWALTGRVEIRNP